MRLAVVAAAFLLAGGAAATAAVPAGTIHGCPHGVRPLPAAYAAPVSHATLAYVHDLAVHGSHPAGWYAGARVTGVLLVRHWFPSGWVKDECGRTVWLRSAGASVYFPAQDMPHNPVGRCNACARIVFLVSLTARGWTVWGTY
jgi:hypothetical protein